VRSRDVHAAGAIELGIAVEAAAELTVVVRSRRLVDQFVEVTNHVASTVGGDASDVRAGLGEAVLELVELGIVEVCIRPLLGVLPERERDEAALALVANALDVLPAPVWVERDVARPSACAKELFRGAEALARVGARISRLHL
jgi:hypothetical protein